MITGDHLFTAVAIATDCGLTSLSRELYTMVRIIAQVHDYVFLSSC
jgi:magnesium-transporting ATPase (P-type)